MRLSKARIRNFQSIKDITLEFGKFTVIVGQSDKGKSAIVRALTSVFTNPTGQSKIRYGESELQVGLVFDNEMSIVYTKGQTSTYRIKGPGVDLNYNKMGRDVPPEVREIVKPWEVGADEYLVQIQKQDAPAFIVGAESGKAAVVRALDDLDGKPYRKALLDCQSSVRKISRALSEAREKEKGLKEKLEILKDLDALIASRERALKLFQLFGILGKALIARRLPKMEVVNTLLRYNIYRKFVLPTNLDNLFVKFDALVAYKRAQSELETLRIEYKKVTSTLAELEKKLFGEGICPLSKSKTCPVTGKEMA